MICLDIHLLWEDILIIKLTITLNYVYNGAEVRLPNSTMPRYDCAYFNAVLPTVEIVGKRKRKK